MPALKKQQETKAQSRPAKTGGPEYILRLFVSGMLENSLRAVKNINQICEQYLKDNYKLDVIDIYQQPDLAVSEQIIVIPIMIIKYPLPERRIIGDMSYTEKVQKILNSK
jgi:circadian clock protein KaiB